MNSKPWTSKGFTLIELIVAIAILAIMASFAGIVFKVSVEAYRIAGANTEIMQKLRAITDQLNTDLKGLRKDGEIFVVWTARPVDPTLDADDADGYLRLDRIMFFANGDFQTYHQTQGDIRSNLARISYMLANTATDKPPQQKREKRTLARTQHILTADRNAPIVPDLGKASESELYEWHNLNECENISLRQWLNMGWDPNKMIALSVIADVNVDRSGLGGGIIIDRTNPHSIHMLFCDGVGEFKIQGWHDKLRRWVPERIGYGDFDIPEPFIPGLLYPYRQFTINGEPEKVGGLVLGGEFAPGQPYYYPEPNLNETHFDEIPGLGRALKFTFTLYDSKGILEGGRTFTHIVYLDD